MTDHHVRPGNASLGEQQMKIVDGLVERVKFRPNVAPSVTRAIIGTDSCEPCYFGLNEFPIKRECCTAVFDDYRWSGIPDAVDVKLAPPDIDAADRSDAADRGSSADLAPSLVDAEAIDAAMSSVLECWSRPICRYSDPHSSVLGAARKLTTYTTRGRESICPTNARGRTVLSL